VDRSSLARTAIASGALVAALALGGCGPGEDQAVTLAAEAARELGQGLPRPAELASITAVRAEGNRLIIDMTLDPWNPPATIQEFRGRAETADRLRLCSDVPTMRLLGLGGVIVNRYSRPGGPAFETRITTCAAPAPPAVPPPGTGGSLADEIAAAVEVMRIGLPRQVDSVSTLTGIRSEGTTVYYEMSINQDVSPAELRTMRPGIQADLQRTMCADPDTSRLIRQGATLNHRYTDPSGDRVDLGVSSCPPAAGGGS
jgi:hypothetical protein